MTSRKKVNALLTDSDAMHVKRHLVRLAIAQAALRPLLHSKEQRSTIAGAAQRQMLNFAVEDLEPAFKDMLDDACHSSETGPQKKSRGSHRLILFLATRG